jgi:DNA-binding MarR family transcriptional regulator
MEQQGWIRRLDNSNPWRLDGWELTEQGRAFVAQLRNPETSEANEVLSRERQSLKSLLFQIQSRCNRPTVANTFIKSVLERVLICAEHAASGVPAWPTWVRKLSRLSSR